MGVCPGNWALALNISGVAVDWSSISPAQEFEPVLLPGGVTESSSSLVWHSDQKGELEQASDIPLHGLPIPAWSISLKNNADGGSFADMGWDKTPDEAEFEEELHPVGDSSSGKDKEEVSEWPERLPL